MCYVRHCLVVLLTLQPKTTTTSSSPVDETMEQQQQQQQPMRHQHHWPMSLPFFRCRRTVCCGCRMYYLRVCPLMAMIKAYLHLNLLFTQTEKRGTTSTRESLSLFGSHSPTQMADSLSLSLSLSPAVISLFQIELLAGCLPAWPTHSKLNRN